MCMKRLLPVVLLFVLASAVEAQSFSDAYDTASEFTDIFIDPNTGLTIFPILMVPSGGRYEGMGTAYTAVSLDAGFLESNPSASSVLDRTELAFTHNNWIAESKLEGVIYTMRFNDLGIGFGGKFLYVPFTPYDEIGSREAGGGYYSESIATANISYNFLSSYSFYGLAIGANLKIAYRDVPAVGYSNQSAVMGLLDVGALTRFNFLKYFTSRSKNFSVGAVVKNLGPNVMGEALPSVVTVGIAYSPAKPVTLAYDLNLPFNIFTTDPSEKINMAGGLNVAVTDFFSIQGGFQYRGANPGMSLGGTVDLDRVSFVANYTLDMTTQLQTADRFSVQAKLNLGDEGRMALRNRVDEYYISGIEEFASGHLEKAIGYLEKALKLDPDFLPAREYLSEVRRQLKNREELRSLQ
jgi:tetratricopeptide (TPR) repeat protein